MGNIETMTKFSRLKSISNIEDNYLEAAKFLNIHKKTTVLESFFDKVSGLQACKFIGKRLQHRYFLVDIANFSRASFLKNI